MATTIIEPGVDTYTARCNGCGCKFTYDEADVRCYNAEEKVQCPHCRRWTQHRGVGEVVKPIESGRM